MIDNMHPYSIDTKERKNILLLLAIVSIGLAYCYKLMECSKIYLPIKEHFKINLSLWVESPSVLFFYGLLFIVFNKWIWKFFRKIRFVKTPNLNGEWKGYLISSFYRDSSNPGERTSAILRISQTWTKIKILLETNESVSCTESASIAVNACEGIRLSYLYICEPKPNADPNMHTHRGTGKLIFNEKENTLIGEYYTGRDRQSYGSANFEREPKCNLKFIKKTQ